MTEGPASKCTTRLAKVARKSLVCLSCAHRLRVEDLDPSVLEYMKDTLGYLTSEVTRALVDNRPSAIMAAYHLLLAKIKRSRRCVKVRSSLTVGRSVSWQQLVSG